MLGIEAPIWLSRAGEADNWNRWGLTAEPG